MTDTRFTLDAEKDGRYFSDSGLTADEVAAARTNADRLGITILAVNEEVPLPATAEGLADMFRGVVK